jgi:hypothetical protein
MPGVTHESLMEMLQANPLMALNPQFMENLVKSKKEEALMQEAKKEEVKKS